MQSLLAFLAVPEYGLGALFIASFLSATLLPLGSEVLLVALLLAAPSRWPEMLAVATLGNSLGALLTWWMGRGARKAYQHWRGDRAQGRALAWLQRFGPKACLLSWLPVVGDPLCAVAGWLRMPFWACTAYIVIGKLGRYAVLTAFTLWF